MSSIVGSLNDGCPTRAIFPFLNWPEASVVRVTKRAHGGRGWPASRICFAPCMLRESVERVSLSTSLRSRVRLYLFVMCRGVAKIDCGGRGLRQGSFHVDMRHERCLNPLRRSKRTSTENAAKVRFELIAKPFGDSWNMVEERQAAKIYDVLGHKLSGHTACVPLFNRSCLFIFCTIIKV